jgi:hypothetical protein
MALEMGIWLMQNGLEETRVELFEWEECCGCGREVQPRWFAVVHGDEVT